MHIRLLAAAVTAIFAAGAADALTYRGSLHAGATTASYTIVTDDTLGVLTAANLLSVTATITSASHTGSFTNPDDLRADGAPLVASASQIKFDPSVEGGFVAGGYSGSAYQLICLTGLYTRCFDEPFGSIFLAADLYHNDYAYTNPVAPYVVARIPEPAAWSLLIAGFGLSGLAVRRRRKIAAAA
jgi:hypothetical protein